MRVVFVITMMLMIYLFDSAQANQAAPAKKPPMRDAATHDSLVIKARKAAALPDPMRDLAKAEGQDPSKVNQPENLLEQSDVICFNGLATLVPKRAILATPSNHKERIGFKPGSKIVPWSTFYTENRGWITTVEVSRSQAEGNRALPEETSTRISKSRNLVVATYKNGPISVLPLKIPDASNPEKTTAASAAGQTNPEGSRTKQTPP